jgi:4-diphosphocytidyl-2-C-methyl-D-erythritol kinase
MHNINLPMTRVFAPAKINLYLHITGRRDDGYHELDSLVAFADIGDVVTIEPASDFFFDITGPFSHHFTAKEKDSSPNSSNLIVQAAWALSRAAHKTLKLRISLIKNLPLSSGLGGGSSDAAAALWGLCDVLGIPRTASFLPAILRDLGADVPVCFACEPARMRGVGDILEPAPAMPEMPVVLINPGVSCPTARVFSHYPGPFHAPLSWPPPVEHKEDLVDFLKAQRNDLTPAARTVVPAIDAVLQFLNAQPGCALARLSGSGATCFGLFESIHAANNAVRVITQMPEAASWWVQAGWLNRPTRY